MPKTTPPPKRVRLTLGQLARYDDILTDALVDNAYYWNRIRKNREKYTPCRKFRKDEIRNILFEDVVCSPDLKRAEERLLRLVGIQNFTRGLKEVEKEHFKKHMRKYINIWQPDCPWEVGTTNRYTILTYEAAAFARRDIRKGEIIKYLCGTLVLMTPEEEKEFDVKRKDFSIVRSSRRQASALFLGPARFSNHDCNANASLSVRGSDGMVVVATRNIALGEEITVTYGDDYFGIDNCECLCHTCEHLARNGWAAGGLENLGTEVGDESEDLFSRAASSTRSKRNRDSLSLASACFSPDPEALLSKKRRKTGTNPSTPIKPRSKSEAPSPMRESQIHDSGDTLKPTEMVLEMRSPAASALTFGHEIATGLAPPETPVTQHQTLEGLSVDHNDMGDLTDQSVPLQSTLPSHLQDPTDMFRVASSTASGKSDEVELIFDPNETVEARTPSSDHSERLVSGVASGNPGEEESVGMKSEEEITPVRAIADHPTLADQTLSNVQGGPSTPNITVELQDSPLIRATIIVPSPVVATLPFALEEDTIEGKTFTWGDEKNREAISDSELSELSELGSDEELDDDSGTVRKRRPLPRRGRPKPSTVVIPSIEEPRVGRRPGDYIRTKELLAHPGSMWADCQTCSGTWVQVDSHETHRECPRCERHSIIYGYTWPKTDQKAGDAERVQDHRTVNRILGPEEQRVLKRRGKGLEMSPFGMSSPRDTPVRTEELSVPSDGRRRSGRRSRS